MARRRERLLEIRTLLFVDLTVSMVRVAEPERKRCGLLTNDSLIVACMREYGISYLASAEALEEGLEAYDGTVLAVTHDRWFARGFDRYLVFGSDGTVYEAAEPVWDEGRVDRAR